MKRLALLFVAAAFVAVVFRAPAQAGVPVQAATAAHGMVVAGHPQAAAIGVAILQEGGNAIDAAVAISLALGVAEPYASGLGGKLMLLYYDAASGRVFAVDAMDACGSAIDGAAYRQRPVDERSYGYSSVCVPGLGAGLWAAHQQWGRKKWADDVAPAIQLARAGFEVLPKTRDFFEEQVKVLRRGDAEIARIFLPGGKLPVIGARVVNADLARVMERFAAQGRDGFYRGDTAAAIVDAARAHGGVLALEDFHGYTARVVEPVTMDFRGYRLVCAPPPAFGAAIFLPIMKMLEKETFGSGPLRTAAHLDELGRAWRIVDERAHRDIGDTSTARERLEQLLTPASIEAMRREVAAPISGPRRAAVDEDGPSVLAGSTTHFLVVDDHRNIVCATQSLSLHFGAGVVAPGTGIVLNDTMSDFSFADPASPNAVAPGRRPRSTVAPTLVFHGDRPEFAVGVPGGARISTAMLQVLLDRLTLNRPLPDAIGDTRVHFVAPTRDKPGLVFEAENSFPLAEGEALRTRGWNVSLPEEAGRGRRFSGINAIAFNADGTLTGYADSRRTNAAAGY